MNHLDPNLAARTPRFSRGRRRLATVLTAAIVVLGPACSSDAEGAGSTTTSESTTTTSTTSPGPVADQTRPQSAFGMVHDGAKLWIADFYGGQVLAVEPDSGAILVRYKGDDGVSDEIDDLAIGPDGSVYWTGFNDGAVGRMTPTNVVGLVAGLEPGINGIAFAPTGASSSAGRSSVRACGRSTPPSPRSLPGSSATRWATSTRSPWVPTG